MKENGYNRTIIHRYEVDDGWRLPYEVMEEIELRIAKARKQEYLQVCKEHKEHKGKWLTAEAARKYQAKSWVYRVLEDHQYVGKVREIGEELQREYGVTELEAINILNGKNVQEYVNKYYRIQNRIPMGIDEQWICDNVIEENGLWTFLAN